MSFLKWLFSDDIQSPPKRKRVFISFAIEDCEYRDHLVSQAKTGRSPFDFIDFSVKQPWEESEWKQKCRTKIKGCHKMIVLLSKHSWHSSGLRWEVRCAKEEGIPIVGMHIRKNSKGTVPPELRGAKIIEWNWTSLEQILK